MLVFIDESGCAGFSLAKGATKFFTITSLVFEDEQWADEAEKRIAGLRRELRLPHDFEFHFTNLKDRNREAFFEVIATVSFCYFAVSVDKRALPANLVTGANEFYRYACGLAVESAKPYLHDATVIVDATGGRVFREELSTHLRRCARDGQEGQPIKRIKFEDSASNSLLQMADMVCGAVARCHMGKPGAAALLKRIAHWEMGNVLWPC